MTPLDHIERVRKLAASAAAWQGQDDRPPGVCNCPTCGVVNARIRAELMRRGWDKPSVHHVHVEGYDFRGAAHPYLASVRVDGAEVYRVHSDLAEVLADDVMDDIENALRRHQC